MSQPVPFTALSIVLATGTHYRYSHHCPIHSFPIWPQCLTRYLCICHPCPLPPDEILETVARWNVCRMLGPTP